MSTSRLDLSMEGAFFAGHIGSLEASVAWGYITADTLG